MPDICMCLGTGCPSKDSCFRHRAKPDMMQNYYAEIPYKDGECDRYWPIEKGIALERLNDS